MPTPGRTCARVDLAADELAHAPVEIVREVLHLGQHLVHRHAGDDLLDPEIARLLGIGVHVHLGHAAEQVMRVTHDVLVGADEEDADVIGLVRLQRVHRQEGLVVQRRDVVAHLAVGIAGQVHHHAAPVRVLLEPVDRHDREALADGPVVQHGLEHGEVAEIEIRQPLLELSELVGHRVELRGAQARQHLGAHGPVQPLHGGQLIQRAGNRGVNSWSASLRASFAS